MRNYIILNNQNSNEITGLLIQTLPPISQPKIRTNIEEIDGRDGDIITKLGYSAYDKEITIGLYGNYNVDDVIKYFTDNQSGIVTFSNEEDKYYNYEILDQIDFERLIRYKTATVTLHCQPFKYSTTEEKIQINATEVSGSGSNITLNNTENGAIFTSLQINGDTSQDGTPTPSSPQDINTISGDNTIKVVGKNLFNDYYSGSPTTSRGLTLSSGNNCVILNGTYDVSGNLDLWITNSNSGSYSNDMILLKANTTYTITVSLNGTYSVSLPSLWVSSRSLDKSTFTWNFKELHYNNGLWSNTFTTSSSDVYVAGIRMPWNSSRTGSFTNNNVYIQIEVGSTATTYEPYNGTDYSINLGSIELCKIGDYQDYIYKENGNWYLHKEIGKVVLDGTSTINDYVGALTNVYVFTAPMNNMNNITSSGAGFCNMYNTIAWNYNLDSESYYSANSTLAFKINKTTIDAQTGSTNKEKCLSFLANNNLILYGSMATPTDTQITDETLISNLETFLSTATTYLNQTNIMTSGSDLDPLLDVTTYAIENPSFNITNSGNIYSKPIITIYGVGTVGLYLNGIQVLSLNMGETTSQITIDVAKLEAYNQETGALMNRNVTGDYNNLSLNVGENIITESGTLQGLEVENYSRWL